MGPATWPSIIVALIFTLLKLDYMKSTPITRFDVRNHHNLLPRQANAHQSGSGNDNGKIVQIRAANVNDEIYQMDLISWVHGHTMQIGNISESDLKAIINSLKQIIRPESPKYPRIKVYNYQFSYDNDGDIDTENTTVTREVLVYADPEEEKQWIINIEDLDLRQNLIIFRLGDLGFGFPKKDTYVVLRKTMATGDQFHYFHLAYVIPRKKGKGKGYKDVEWDNIRPKEMLPIPLIYKEPKGVHETHCKARDCDVAEIMFGTCAIARLTCEDLKDLPIYGRDKERMDSLIREQQPFIYELARSEAINKKYLKGEKKRKKRSTYGNLGNIAPHTLTGIDLSLDPGYIHRTVKKDIAADSHVLTLQSSQRGGENTHAVAKAVTPSKPLIVSGTVAAVPSNAVNKSPAPGESANEPVMKRIVRKEEDEIPFNDQSFSEDQNGAIPSSYDSLQLGTDLDPNSPDTSSLDSGQEMSYFETILEKIRNSPATKYTFRPLECVGCEPLGTFFSEFEETALIAYIANNIVHDIFKNTSSAVFSPEPQIIMEEHKTVPYIGYGSCPYSVRTISNPPKSTELDDLIDYYTETLAVNCEVRTCELQRQKTRLREILTSKFHFLEVWPDMTVRFNKSSLLPKNQLLSSYEFKQFMTSLIISVYTTEYHMQILSKIEPDIPNLSNTAQSKRMKFQTRMLLRVLDELIKNFPQHLIKGARYVLQILQDKYLALVAEHVAIINLEFNGGESERDKFKELNKNDRLQALALKDFIMNGFATITKSGAGVLNAFTTFYNHNHDRVSNLLVEFGVDRRRAGEPNDGKKRSAAVDNDYEEKLLERIWTKDAKDMGLIAKIIDDVDFDVEVKT